MRAPTVITAALLATACGSDSVETPTSSSPAQPAATTITFAGSLEVGASRFYSFTAGAGGSVSVTLASVATLSGGVPLPMSLGVGVGIPSGIGCALMQLVSAPPGLNAQLQHPINQDVHCVSVFDEGR